MDEFTLTLTEKSASALRDWFDEQDEELIENLFKGEGSFILEHNERRVTLAPVKHGRWIDYCGDALCSECEYVLKDYYTNYCPNCGAKMEDEE